MNDFQYLVQDKMKVLFVNKSFASPRRCSWRLVAAAVLVAMAMAYFPVSYFLSRRSTTVGTATVVAVTADSAGTMDGSLLSQLNIQLEPSAVSSTPPAHTGDWEWNAAAEDDDMALRSVPARLLQRTACPACFGDDLCHAVVAGEIQVAVPTHPQHDVHARKGVYFGKWHEDDVMVKTLDDWQGSKFKR